MTTSMHEFLSLPLWLSIPLAAIYIGASWGMLCIGSIVRNVNLADTRITGYDSTGGIVGYNYGTITDCTVAANVCIHSVITNRSAAKAP